MNIFEIREGNGNDGEYLCGTIIANDAFDALRKASRTKMIYKPKSVTLGSMDGDDQSAYLADYRQSQMIFGDSCGWTASATIIR